MDKVDSEAVPRELSSGAQRVETKALAPRLQRLFQPISDEKPDRVDQLLLEIEQRRVDQLLHELKQRLAEKRGDCEAR